MNTIIFFFCLLLPTINPTTETNTYCNARFDFCVEYPSGLFTEKIKPTNADGILLRNEDQEISLAIYGEYNILSYSLIEQHKLMLEALKDTDGPIIDHLTVFTEDGFVSTIEFKNHTIELRCQKQDIYFVNTLIRVKDKHDLADTPIRIELDLNS